MVDMLFRPFRLSRWFAIGFTAFLAMESGGGSCNFSVPDFGGGSPGPARMPQHVPPVQTPPGTHGSGASGTITTYSQGGVTYTQPHSHGAVHAHSSGTSYSSSPDPWDALVQFTQSNVTLAAVIAVVAIALMLSLTLLFMWLKSRGLFMFMHNIATNRAEVVLPWHDYRAEGNSLFMLNIAVLFLWMATVAIMAGTGWLLLFQHWVVRGPSVEDVLPGLIFFPFVILLALVWALVLAPLLFLLVPPMMLARRCGARAAIGYVWSEIVRPYKWQVALFILMNLLLGMAVGIAVTLVTCVTCCIAALPYIGTVLTLPAWVFMRAYGMYFVDQFGGEWRVIKADTTGPVCRVCGYSLLGLHETTLTCPECGTPLDGLIVGA